MNRRLFYEFRISNKSNLQRKNALNLISVEVVCELKNFYNLPTCQMALKSHRAV
jgi:hypothetical protein